MESFKNWLQEDVEGKSLNSAGLDVNPAQTVQAATQAFQAYAADKAHADDLAKMRLASGNVSISKAITGLSPQIAAYSSIPIVNQEFTAPDIGNVVAREYFPRQKIFMKKMMRKMMLKKMGIK